jgi:hypothetical protein
MSYYGIRMCDFCGKRTEEIAGHLKLIKCISVMLVLGVGDYVRIV